MTVAGFVFQHFLAEAIESVLLVNFMEISVSGVIACNYSISPSLLAGRQVLVSPFVHYWSGEGVFWLVCGEFFKIIFSVTHNGGSFHSFRVNFQSE